MNETQTSQAAATVSLAPMQMTAPDMNFVVTSPTGVFNNLLKVSMSSFKYILVCYLLFVAV